MKCLKFTYLIFMLIAADGFSKDSDFYAMGRQLLGEMVEIESTETKGLATDVSEYAASVLLEHGFQSDDLQVAGPTEISKGLYAVYRGSSQERPTIVMAHIDVVPAVEESWISDPFMMTEIEGFLHGRGTADNKGGAAGLKFEASSRNLRKAMYWKQMRCRIFLGVGVLILLYLFAASACGGITFPRCRAS